MDLACALDAVSLPVELTDGIIDYLADDRSSLRTTSLVCRAWCPRSRSHLFHTVHVKAVRKSFRSFLAFLNHNDQRPQCSPPISRLIRCLHLYGSRRCDYRPQDGADEVVSTITSTFLVDLFAALPGLKEPGGDTVRYAPLPRCAPPRGRTAELQARLPIDEKRLDGRSCRRRLHPCAFHVFDDRHAPDRDAVLAHLPCPTDRGCSRTANSTYPAMLSRHADSDAD